MQKNSKKTATKWELFFLYSRNSISILRGFLIIPLYMRFIEIELYSAWLATGNILLWIQILDPGTSDVLKQKIGESIGANKKEQLSLIMTSGWLISFAITLGVFILGIILVNYLDSILKLESEIDNNALGAAFFIAVIGTCFTLFNHSINAINRGFLKTKETGIITVLSNLIGLIVNLTLLFQGYGLLSIAYGILVTGSLLLAGNISLQLKIINNYKLKPTFNMPFLRNFTKVFSYTFFSKISKIVVEKTDLLIISRFIGVEMVSAFELTRRPIVIVLTFCNRASVALIPALSQLRGENNIQNFKKIFLRYFNYWSWLGFLVISGFILFNKELISLWIGKELFIGQEINILLCVALLLKSYTYNISNFTFSFGNIKGNSIISIIKSAIYIILMLILLPIFDIYGVVFALLFSLIFSEIIYYTIIIIKLTEINRKELLRFGTLILKLGLLIIFVSFVNFNYNIATWEKLILYCSIYSLSYVLFLFIVHKAFRFELQNIYKKI